MYDQRAHNTKLMKDRRQHALSRNELRWPTEARQSAAGVTSFPVKAEEATLRAEVEAWKAKRGRR